MVLPMPQDCSAAQLPLSVRNSVYISGEWNIYFTLSFSLILLYLNRCSLAKWTRICAQMLLLAALRSAPNKLFYWSIILWLGLHPLVQYSLKRWMERSCTTLRLGHGQASNSKSSLRILTETSRERNRQGLKGKHYNAWILDQLK